MENNKGQTNNRGAQAKLRSAQDVAVKKAAIESSWEGFNKYMGVQGILGLMLVTGFIFASVRGIVLPELYNNMMTLSLPVPMQPGLHLYYVTVTNYWGETDPSDLAVTNVPQRGQNMRATR